MRQKIFFAKERPRVIYWVGIIIIVVVAIFAIFLGSKYDRGHEEKLNNIQAKKDVTTPIFTPVAPVPIIPSTEEVSAVDQNTTTHKNSEKSQVKHFPAIHPDASAATIYSRISGQPITLDQAENVGKLNKVLDRCWSSSTYRRMAQSIPPQTDPKSHGVAQRLAKQEEANARSDCGDLPSDAFNKADEWTAELASQGDPRSMLDYGNPYWIRDLSTATRDPLRLIEYRSNTVAYLNKLIDKGYADALVMMGAIKMNSSWGEPKPDEAWAYMYAAAKAQGNVSIQASLLQTIDQRVAREHQKSANELTQQLIRRCCGG